MKKMMKKISFLAALGTLLLFLTACGSESRKLVGLWDDGYGTTWEFQSDGTVIEDGDTYASYSVEDGELVIYDIDGGDEVQSCGYTLSGDDLIISAYGDEAVFHKVH